MWEGKEGWTPNSCSSVNVIATNKATGMVGSKPPAFLLPVSFTFHSFGSKVICTVVLGGSQGLLHEGWCIV